MKGRMTNTERTNRPSHGYATGGPVKGSPDKPKGSNYPAGAGFPSGKKIVEQTAAKGSEEKFTMSGGSVEGLRPTPRLDRPGRQRGGRVGADQAPLSSAAMKKGGKAGC
jgi:hypothetical protein